MTDTNQWRANRELLNRIFDRTIRSYITICHLPPVIASDPDPSRHPVRLTPSAIEYKADIETATHCALPEAADYDTWAQLVRIGAGLIPDREIPAHEAQRVINKVAPEYRKRELYNIKKYFTHVRKRVA